MFDEQNCLALFRVFDRSNSGYVSMAQYKEGTAVQFALSFLGMKYIRVEDYNECPDGYAEGRISAQSFTKEWYEGWRCFSQADML